MNLNGMLFYTKTLNIKPPGSKKSGVSNVVLKKPVIAMVLGSLQDPKKEVTKLEIEAQIAAQIGWISCDRIESILGEKKAAAFLEKVGAAIGADLKKKDIK